MLTHNEQKTLERLGRMMQDMGDMQKAQLCAFTEGPSARQWNQNGTNLEPEWNHSIE